MVRSREKWRGVPLADAVRYTKLSEEGREAFDEMASMYKKYAYKVAATVTGNAGTTYTQQFVPVAPQASDSAGMRGVQVQLGILAVSLTCILLV